MRNIWSRINYRLARMFHLIARPRMFSFPRNFQNLKVSGLRIGNTTFIDHPKYLKLENNIYIGHHNFIEASQGITVENNCQITSFVTITTHSSHQSVRLYGAYFSKVKNPIGYEKGPIKIGACSFVGPFTVIMPNTFIGKGSVITSHSYVKGEFPDFAIISGNPAKIIGDTREKDKELLEKFPELQQFYMTE